VPPITRKIPKASRVDEIATSHGPARAHQFSVPHGVPRASFTPPAWTRADPHPAAITGNRMRQPPGKPGQGWGLLLFANHARASRWGIEPRPA